MRTTLFLVFLAGGLAADVVVLKEGGEKVSGRVTDKQSHVEVMTDQGLRTFLKDEVDRIITGPQEFVGGSEQAFEQAKADYQRMLGLPAAEQNAVIRGAVANLTKAREAYAGARDLFPEDKYSDLDKKLMQIMQLMRLLRERMGSEIARSASPVDRKPTDPPRVERPAAATSLEEAFALLVDAARRQEPGARRGARDAFRSQRSGVPDLYDLATAAMIFLSKTDADWGLAGPALAAVQEYVAKPWLKEPLKLTPALHQEAAGYLVEKIAATKKAGASTEALWLFALGHLGGMVAGPEHEKIARALGLTVAEGLAGTPEGHAVRDLAAWIASGEFDLAVRAFVNEYRSIDTPSVRFVWSFALLHLVIQKKRGFDRPVSALATVRGDGAVQGHVAALSKSIQTVSPCSMCAGDGWLRCTNCHGQKTIYNICKACNGSRMVKNKQGTELFCNACNFTGIASKLECGKCKDGYFDCPKCKLPACTTCSGAGRSTCRTCKGLKVLKNQCGACGGSGRGLGAGGVKGGGLCQVCKGSGNDQIRKCAACTGGFNDCMACEPVRKIPAVEDICETSPCAPCEGRGLAFRRVALPCRSCLGLGKKLAPKADPAKVLAD
jgi:hypothetical protein